MASTRPVSFKDMLANLEVGQLLFSIGTVLYWNSPFIFSWWMSLVHKLSRSGGQCYKWGTSRKKFYASTARGIHLLPTWVDSEKRLQWFWHLDWSFQDGCAFMHIEIKVNLRGHFRWKMWPEQKYRVGTEPQSQSDSEQQRPGLTTAVDSILGATAS